MENNERSNKIQEIVEKVTDNKIEEKEKMTETFDTKLTAYPGDYVYFADVKVEKRMIDKEIKVFARPEKMQIVKVQIVKLIYDSRAQIVILYGKDLYGKQYKCAQEYFFTSQKAAKDAIEKVCKAYEKERWSDIYDIFDREIEIKYQYSIEFLLKPYDIILTKNKHFAVEAIELFLDINERIEFGFVPASDILYLKNKKIVDETKFASFALKKI